METTSACPPANWPYSSQVTVCRIRKPDSFSMSSRIPWSWIQSQAGSGENVKRMTPSSPVSADFDSFPGPLQPDTSNIPAPSTASSDFVFLYIDGPPAINAGRLAQSSLTNHL